MDVIELGPDVAEVAPDRRRIIAAAERKIRLRPGEPVRLTVEDFPIRR